MSVTKSNVLISASYQLTLNEQRILLLSIAKLNPLDANIAGRTITVSAFELSEAFNVNIKDSRNALKAASNELYERNIYLTENGKPKKIRWLEGASQFLDEKDRMELTYTSSIMPYISQLKGNYTTYKLAGVANLKSPNSVRMYELLKQFKKSGKKEVSIVELKNELGLGDKYKDWRDFKKDVLNVTTKELNLKSDLKNIDYKVIKTGRKITHLKFTFTPEAKKKPLNRSHKQTEMELKKRKSALKNRKVIT